MYFYCYCCYGISTCTYCYCCYGISTCTYCYCTLLAVTAAVSSTSVINSNSFTTSMQLYHYNNRHHTITACTTLTTPITSLQD
ncbi:hypothetical protein DPMN_015952 [Dreissena polymorpha]|uniref:Uncharacterized protein n=1 Tax=Dreissena polymorpha TaxID=45954 RepID=A0A9D4NDU1_DREPO|nr:hypothetical protein DPMN_015952 [Dreissena polymorpha]